MSNIKILPDIVSNKIAAGEVVERPASVVKELVENSIDAGSSKIIVEVEKGGKSLIRVSDDGMGMNKDDALLSIERYATSKIFDDHDLYAIRTLGFRGEALPSIAAVSRFSLVTKEKDSSVGTEIFVEGGKIKKVLEAGAPQGTMITAAQLFYNIPARRKFLKTIGTELGHISDTLAGVALGRPDIRLKLISDGKVLKDWSVVSKGVDRALDVLGKDIKNDLLPIEFKNDMVSIKGWIVGSQYFRSTSRGIYIYVNGRHVRDRVINHALFEGYGQRIAKGKYPLATLFLTVPFDQVDVNVHPAKHEVRFSRQNDIHNILAQVVSETLHRNEEKGSWARSDVSVKENTSHISESIKNYSIKNNSPTVQNDLEVREGIKADAILPAAQTTLWEKKRFEDLRVIGQLQNTYILCESESSLILIDQHAAHERIMFEQLKDKSNTKAMESQTLLVPETFDVGYKEADILEKLIPELKKAGVDIQNFGKGTFVVKSVPAILSGIEIKPVIMDIIEKIADIGFASDIQKTIDTCLILMACHSAIRANQSLTDEQIKELMRQLDQCKDPSHCPHGRPTYITWSTAFLEKSFGRKG